jgi:hypothetical protein
MIQCLFVWLCVVPSSGLGPLGAKGTAQPGWLDATRVRESCRVRAGADVQEVIDLPLVYTPSSPLVTLTAIAFSLVLLSVLGCTLYWSMIA